MQLFPIIWEYQDRRCKTPSKACSCSGQWGRSPENARGRRRAGYVTSPFSLPDPARRPLLFPSQLSESLKQAIASTTTQAQREKLTPKKLQGVHALFAIQSFSSSRRNVTVLWPSLRVLFAQIFYYILLQQLSVRLYWGLGHQMKGFSKNVQFITRCVASRRATQRFSDVALILVGTPI